jgi:putative transposase
MSTRRGRVSIDMTVASGSRWQVGDEAVTVVAITAVDAVLVEDCHGDKRSVRPGELHPIDDGQTTQTAIRAAAVTNADPPAWQKARRIAADIEELAKVDPVSDEAVQCLALRWHVSRATVWRRLDRYRQQGDLSAFIAKRRGLKSGASLLSAEADALIRNIARRFWHQTENAPLSDIVPTIQKECRARDIDAPSRATIARRLRALRTDPEYFAGEARAALRERRRLVRGNYEAANALDVVQIDHTVADVMLVDPQSRQPIGRPTFTVAIDVATRCVMGMCLSLEAPSSLLVALCLEHAVFPKDEWLGAMGSSASWPMYGRMKSIHCDNGKEFHSAAFHRGCDLNRIDAIYRPPATPRFGGHIERLIGTLMRRVRLLPGNTYSDMLKRRPRHAEARAALTMADLRWFLTDEIARYHQSIHRTLGVTPRSAWERAWGRNQGMELPAVPLRRQHFLLDFLPIERRVITREGIEVQGLKFSHAELAREIDPGRQRIVRLDPRDISRIYLARTDDQYLTVPLQRRDLPAISWWEWRALRKLWRQPRHAEPGTPSTRPYLQSLPNALQGATALRRRRHAARKAEWQAVQALQALPAPNVSLSAVVSSNSDVEQLSWEILE